MGVERRRLLIEAPANDIALGLRTNQGSKETRAVDIGRVSHQSRTPRPRRSRVEQGDGTLKCVSALRITTGHCPLTDLRLSRTRGWGAFKGQLFAGIFGPSGVVVSKIWRRCSTLFEPHEFESGSSLTWGVGVAFGAFLSLPSEIWTSAVARSGVLRSCREPRDDECQQRGETDPCTSVASPG